MGKNKKIRLKGRLRIYLQAMILLGVLLVLVNLFTYFLSVQAGLFLSAFVVVYFIIILLLMNYNRPVLINELVSFATNYGQIQKTLLRELELPYAVLDDNGKIIWTNTSFETVTHKEKGYRKNISTLFPSLTVDKLPRQVEETQETIEFEDRIFQAKMKKISITDMTEGSAVISAPEYDGFLVALYLFDETALQLALKENDNQSLCVGLIYMDNYDEALESVESVRRSLLTALIERKIDKYISAYDGIVKRMEKDKFFVVLRKESVRQLRDLKFDLLEDVKTVNIGNEMAVTLSMGFGCDGLSYTQNYEFARNAIDLALGRGGDQAVVKTPENVIYFGGKSQSVEKNTRVKARVKAHALREIITAKDEVLVMGHRLADVDAFGSAVGIACIAKALDRNVHIVLEDITQSLKPIVDYYKEEMDGAEDLIVDRNAAMAYAGANSVLIVVDVNKPSITECPELLKSVKSIVVLDHHRQGTEVIENATLSYVEPYASSACEMVAEILQYIGDEVKISTAEADCMYSGIIVDTNSFLSKTGVRTFEAAAYLRRSGADVTRVRKMFREDASDYKAKAEAVRQAEIYNEHYAIAICPTAGVMSPTVVGAQAANDLLNIVGIKASFVFTEYQGKIYISGRSIDEVNVQVILEKLGGGGHMNIAGAQLEGVSIWDAIQMLRDVLEQMTREGELK
ncbi:MAG: DHH family phosphoesterase [Lachnospiraceae bacterium]|nr:DHH family phosphoesterase [Candidatus Merdinaster equi]